ncbi:MAG: DUF5017 domain-containing protein [Ferruginibacter sp.]|nr:DUF5017 domain-containing protein [Ferruginibacter sp.]
MKRNILKILLTGFTTCLFFSCTKDKLEEANLEITTTKNTFKVNEPVQFSLTGNPEIISFYSGEAGKEYQYKNRTTRNDGVLKFGFQTRVDNTAGFAALASGSIKILLSTNFTGNYSTLADPLLARSEDSAMVNTATWTDITSRFFIPTSGIVATFYPSNEISISDLIVDPNKPIYLALKYASPSTGSLGTNGITIGLLVFYNTFPNGSVVNYTIAPGGTISTVWKVIRAANVDNAWSTSSTQLRFTSLLTTQYSEDWAVTNAFFPSVTTPDKPSPIKSITENQLSKYSYRYTMPGTYKVTFVASNNRVYGSNEVTKELTITIIP